MISFQKTLPSPRKMTPRNSLLEVQNGGFLVLHIKFVEAHEVGHDS